MGGTREKTEKMTGRNGLLAATYPIIEAAAPFRPEQSLELSFQIHSLGSWHA